MAEQNERKSESWIAWITLLLAALAWLCAVVVSATTGVGKTIQADRNWPLGQPGIQLPMLLASPIYAVLSLVSYFVLKRLGHHSRKNTAGLALSSAWLVAFLTFALVSPDTLRGGRAHWPVWCLGNLKHIGFGCHCYAGENDGNFPPGLEALHDRHVYSLEQFICPRTWNRIRRYRWRVPDDITEEYLTYKYVPGLKATDPDSYVLVFDDEPNHDGEDVNVLQVGGHLGFRVDIATLQERLRKQAAELAEQGRQMRIVELSWGNIPKPVYVLPPWYMGWAGAFACVAVGFVIPVGGLLLWEHWRKRRRAGVP